jgi:hypothetical protein
MPHVDEGTLHALLDGELAPDELAEVRLHFATCPSCAGRLDEARQLLAETERLVSALQMPGPAGAGAAAAQVGGFTPRPARPEGGTLNVLLPAQPPGAPLPPLDPVVLIPENPTVREVRRGRLRVMAWAAGFLVIVGAGYLGVTNYPTRAPAGDGRLRLSADEFRSVEPGAAREGPADTVPTIALTDSSVSAAPAEADTENARKKAAVAAAPDAKPPAVATPKPPAAPPPARAGVAQQRADTAAVVPPRTESEERLAKAAEAPPPTPASPSPTKSSRDAAAQATSDLERQRIRERAAAATAALDRDNAARRAAAEREERLAAERAAANRARVAAAPASAAAAADNRTGITTRIGLDEAARQLGGPLHAIDGLSRQMVGLVPGASVEGADPDRPVVRAVYVDRATGTTVFLDQQMAQPGDGPSSPRAGAGGRQMWVKDGVLLVLHGDVGTDSLRSLARRVR